MLSYINQYGYSYERRISARLLNHGNIGKGTESELIILCVFYFYLYFLLNIFKFYIHRTLFCITENTQLADILKI